MTLRPILFAAAMAALLPLTPSTAQEPALAAAVKADAARGEALLKTLVEQNSGSRNLAGVKRVGELVRAELTELGFDARWVDMRETGRAGHVVATHRGNGKGKRVLMIGHLDTVFEPDNGFTGWKVEGRRAIGPGVVDDKGGMVVILQALRAMKAAGTLARADIMVVMTGDEEATGRPLDVARRDLIAAGDWADIALEYEAVATEDGREFGTTARRSSTSWTLSVRGKTGHSSGIFNAALGYGANYELARILDTFRRELAEQYLTYNVGIMGGGAPAALAESGDSVTASGKTNIIAETAFARGDLRALTREQNDRTIARMKAIVAASLPGTQAEIQFAESYPPMAPTAGNRALLAELNRVNRDLGLPEMAEFDPAKRGAADSSFVADRADTLGGMGPAGGNAHAAGEWVDLDSIPRQALRSAMLITRLSQTPRGN
ncbi:M20/M25/M40 family metallo-hydrolase [Sphingomonas sp. BGYR3]|uniref:M20/M25/M40 family metallo-hydrolase n=1 Tax=Sphingomonas sp. BGYR3 TaxID=2975483 RepID=UPI0021A271EA|nr:M20/M25/M40 family metallo-hydrolase [Sphingomonas sp. BGYR3]MDG5489895.1 M20/M25/M40 family metallo-hydrolase [Sphingomonas sp. BGYR3]